MKFSMEAEELSRTLQSVVSAVPPKSTLPILSNFLLEARDGALQLTCTDLDMAVCTRAPSQVSDKGRVTVPARRFAEIVKELPTNEVSVASDDLRVTLDCSVGQFTLMGMDAEEFPKLPEVQGGVKISLPGDLLARAIRFSSYAAGTDDARPVLNGVLLELRDGELCLVATDGHRLARVSFRQNDLKGSSSPIIVPRTLQLVQKLAGESTGPVVLTLSEKHAIFEIGSTTIYSRLVDGPFPSYDQVIPRDNPHKLTVDRNGLIAAVRRISILSDSITHQIRLDVEKEKVALSVQTADVGEGAEQLEAEYTGDPIAVGFNASYLLDALKGMESEKVVLALKEPSAAVVIKPATQADSEDILCLVMPIKLAEA